MGLSLSLSLDGSDESGIEQGLADELIPVAPDQRSSSKALINEYTIQDLKRMLGGLKFRNILFHYLMLLPSEFGILKILRSRGFSNIHIEVNTQGLPITRENRIYTRFQQMFLSIVWLCMQRKETKSLYYPIFVSDTRARTLLPILLVCHDPLCPCLCTASTPPTQLTSGSTGGPSCSASCAKRSASPTKRSTTRAPPVPSRRLVSAYIYPTLSTSPHPTSRPRSSLALALQAQKSPPSPTTATTDHLRYRRPARSSLRRARPPWALRSRCAPAPPPRRAASQAALRRLASRPRSVAPPLAQTQAQAQPLTLQARHPPLLPLPWRPQAPPVFTRRWPSRLPSALQRPARQPLPTGGPHRPLHQPPEPQQPRHLMDPTFSRSSARHLQRPPLPSTSPLLPWPRRRPHPLRHLASYSPQQRLPRQHL